MTHVILHLGVLALTVFALSRLLPGLVRVRSAGTAVLVAVVFSVLNFFLGWAIRAMLFVPALLTLGVLFFFVPFLVNAALLWLTDRLLGGFELRGLRGLLVSAAIITLVNAVFATHAAWGHSVFSGATRWV